VPRHLSFKPERFGRNVGAPGRPLPGATART